MFVVRGVAVLGIGLLGCAAAGPEVGVKHAELREAFRGDPEAAPEFAAVKDRLRDSLVKLKARELGRDLREKATILYIDPDLQPN